MMISAWPKCNKNTRNSKMSTKIWLPIRKSFYLNMNLKLQEWKRKISLLRKKDKNMRRKLISWLNLNSKVMLFLLARKCWDGASKPGGSKLIFSMMFGVVSIINYNSEWKSKHLSHLQRIWKSKCSKLE